MVIKLWSLIALEKQGLVLNYVFYSVECQIVIRSQAFTDDEAFLLLGVELVVIHDLEEASAQWDHVTHDDTF